MIYLIHFDRPFKRWKHYLGDTNDLEYRIKNYGSKFGGIHLLQEATAAGIGYSVVNVWSEADGTKRKNLSRLCPICNKKRGVK